MIDVIIVSKDRPLQLYSCLESMKLFLSGYNKIHVIIKCSNDRYLKAYTKLATIFSDVDFINEEAHGFKITYLALLQELNSNNILLELDDAVYVSHFDLCIHDENLNNRKFDCGKISFGSQSTLFDMSNFIHSEYYHIIDREKIPTTNISDIQKLCLQYPFNMGSSIHIKKDLQVLLELNDIKNPFEMEWIGSSSYIFGKYKFIFVVRCDNPIIRQLHINNFLNRYENKISTYSLLEKFENDEVLDLDYNYIKNSPPNMFWFNGGNTDGKFPVFPWDIDPIYYDKVLKFKRL